MKLLTVNEIIEELKKRGRPISKEKFNYYSKIGLLYAPEKKMKKRVKEGIVSYYAEECISEVWSIYEFKKDGFSLEEIKDFMIGQDKALFQNIYKKIRIAPCMESDSSVNTIRSLSDLNDVIEQWRNTGYYTGLYSILKSIIQTIRIEMAAINSQIEIVQGFQSELTSEMKCSPDKESVKKYFTKKENSRTKWLLEQENKLVEFERNTFAPLHTFLHNWCLI